MVGGNRGRETHSQDTLSDNKINFIKRKKEKSLKCWITDQEKINNLEKRFVGMIIYIDMDFIVCGWKDVGSFRELIQ